MKCFMSKLESITNQTESSECCRKEVLHLLPINYTISMLHLEGMTSGLVRKVRKNFVCGATR